MFDTKSIISTIIKKFFTFRWCCWFCEVRRPRRCCGGRAASSSNGGCNCASCCTVGWRLVTSVWLVLWALVRFVPLHLSCGELLEGEEPCTGELWTKFLSESSGTWDGRRPRAWTCSSVSNGSLSRSGNWKLKVRLQQNVTRPNTIAHNSNKAFFQILICNKM